MHAEHHHDHHDSPAAAAAAAAAAAVSTSTWNTRNLAPRVASDAASAGTAALMVAPVIATIDRAIMENASGALTLAGSLRASLGLLLRHPGQMLLARPCRLIALLYGGTYLTVNLLDTATATATGRPASHVTAGVAKFAASSSANVSLTMYKDAVFVRLFGPPGAAPRAIPMASYALFAARDSLTTFASFILPARLGPVFSRHLLPDPETAGVLGRAFSSHVSGQTLAQFAAPAAMQVLSAPLHLLGLDLYNRPSGAAGGLISGRNRWAAICKNWSVTAAARISRIIPAYGVGGVVNLKMRTNLMKRLE
ncbi:hypothetical protein CMQ_3388 [Grosmannia clavigera kw1407]|uniref:Sequence orphan n=1 Tax=Grosmannia clavigera (strain kw1407 / UAMH 11150) TaxID=655863 RepID=F0X8F5_GROCL|nr:uncharacterized protein CMQ_3388 [Grosmannia clavigera kw1407]EFX05319.1 hypothetical protein CMQ_3388 [Grosmannia clavigera kw1407]